MIVDARHTFFGFRFGVMLAALGLAMSGTRAEPLITEFMASNTASRADDDGAFSDWIEIHNPDPAAVDLGGWFLTDTATNLTRWQIPAATLAPGGYLIVFASNKDRREPGRELHTNFALAAEGEFLALVKPDGVTVASSYAPAYPRQSNDVSYGLMRSEGGVWTEAFFTTPTPGAPNTGGGGPTLSETVTFSHSPGPFASSFELALSGAGSGQHIRYVSVPASETGAVAAEPTATSPAYTGPLPVKGPLKVRAAVFSDDLKSRGRSSEAQFSPLDFGSGQSLAEFSTHLPVLVIEQNGFRELEKSDGKLPAWIYGYAAGAPGEFTFSRQPDFVTPIDVALRGHSSAQFPKSSYNIDLVNDQGKSAARPLFDERVFDEWALVGPWFYDPALIRNSFVYALSNRIGRWAPRIQPVEVFVNAYGGGLDTTTYNGVYLLTDKVRIEKGRVELQAMSAGATSAAEITGGYLLKIDFPDPDEFSWTTNLLRANGTESTVVVASPKADKLSPEQRIYIQGYLQSMENALLSDQATGWSRRTYLDFIDRPSWVDHHILNTFVANPDALERSAFFSKDRGGKFVAGPVWDFDRALGSIVDERGVDPERWHAADAVWVWDFAWWGVLARDPEFMQDWVDRWQSLRRGQFGDASLKALVDELAGAVGPDAAARDAARWTDNVSPAGTHADEIDYIKSWLERRGRWIDAQFVAPPEVVVQGGVITLVPAEGAQIAYTLDGSDPRSLGGELAPNAVVTAENVEVPVSSNLQARSYRADLKEVYPGSPWSSAVGGGNSTPLAPQSRLVNISSRAIVGADENALIAGVVVADTQGKRYLARAIGPALGEFGVGGIVPDPQLSIFSSSGVELARNNGWRNGPDAAQLPQYARTVGAFPLPTGSDDSALAPRLASGGYTIQVTTPSGQEGVALAELYELDANGRTVNLSTRAQVGTGDRVLIGGFVVKGVAHKRMLIRAVGPTLGIFGVANALIDPVLTVYSGTTVVASNDSWSASENAAVVAAASTRVGAFGLAVNSEDAALLITLAPGAYTIEVAGKDNTEGVALLEIYEVP